MIFEIKRWLVGNILDFSELVNIYQVIGIVLGIVGNMKEV